MRKITIWILTGLVFPLVISCGKDEVAGNSLEGRWNLLYEEWEVKMNGEITSSDRYDFVKGDYMDFGKGGVLTIWSSADIMKTSYQIIDNRVLIANNEEWETDFPAEGFEIRKNGNKLTLVGVDKYGFGEYRYEDHIRIYLER